MHCLPPLRRSAELSNIKLRRSEKKVQLWGRLAARTAAAMLQLLMLVPGSLGPLPASLARLPPAMLIACRTAPDQAVPRLCLNPSLAPTKQVLNEVNHSDRVRFPLMNPAKPTKVLERVATGADKIFVLVSACRQEPRASV